MRFSLCSPKVKVKELVPQLCPTLLDLMHCSPPGSSVPGILQSRIPGLVAVSLLHGDLPNAGIEPRSPELQAGSLPSEPPGKPYI